MNFNPAKYFIKRYHSADLSPKELKRMLNLWIPFLFNRIHIKYISNDFSAITVILKHTFWNRNPNKAIWGGSIFSAADPFFPIMLKQIAIRNNIKTNFFTKSTKVEYLKQAKTDLIFHFTLNEEAISKLLIQLKENGKFEGWHTVTGKDMHDHVCIKAQILSHLRIRD